MVGGHIGDHRHMGGLAHGHQLEGGKLHHGEVLRLHFPGHGQQGLADVAPQPHPLPFGLEHFGDEGGCGGFAIGTGDGQDGTGADFKEHFHFGSKAAALGLGLLQGGQVGPDARRAEDHFLGQVLKVPLPQLEPDAHFFQLAGGISQLLSGFFIAGGDTRPGLAQKPDEGAVGNADAQHRRFLPVHRAEKSFHFAHLIIPFSRHACL